MELEYTDYHDIIKVDWIDTYERNIQLLWEDIQALSSNAYILKILFNFPFYQILGGVSPFWRLFRYNYYQHSIIIITKLLSGSKDSITIRTFRSEIQKNIVNEEVKKTFAKDIRQLGFTKKIREIERKAGELRNNKVAHCTREWNSSITIDQLNKLAPSIREIETCADSICNLYKYLCFNTQYTVDPRLILQADIEYLQKLLDERALNGKVLNMPERDPEEWRIYRMNITPEDESVINEWRAKFGLKKV